MRRDMRTSSMKNPHNDRSALDQIMAKGAGSDEKSSYPRDDQRKGLLWV